MRKRRSCFQCGRKGHVRNDCKYFKRERKLHAPKRDSKKANASLSKQELKTSLCDVTLHVQDMQRTKSDVIDALMTVDDGLSQTWIEDAGASFHVNPCLECFATRKDGNLGKVILAITMLVPLRE